MSALSVIHAAATWFMASVLWFVQLAHYPRFAAVPAADFPAFQASNIRKTALLVGPLMVVEGVTALLLVWRRCGAASWAGLGVLAALWASTFFVQLPLHRALERGFEPALHARLLRTNRWRTGGWTLRGLLALWLLKAGG